MNIYKRTFVVKCPSDNEMIVYEITIYKNKTVYVEHINTELNLIREGYQEDIADILHKRFGGYQETYAVHQGVEIVTKRGSF